MDKMTDVYLMGNVKTKQLCKRSYPNASGSNVNFNVQNRILYSQNKI